MRGNRPCARLGRDIGGRDDNDFFRWFGCGLVSRHDNFLQGRLGRSFGGRDDNYFFGRRRRNLRNRDDYYFFRRLGRNLRGRDDNDFLDRLGRSLAGGLLGNFNLGRLFFCLHARGQFWHNGADAAALSAEQFRHIVKQNGAG